MHTLYTYFRSSCATRVRIALNLKGIEYQPKFVNLVSNDQLAADFDAINPNHRVPVLVLPDGASLGQSIAIMEYLDEAHPDAHRLLPKDAVARARVRELVETINADTQPLQNLAVLRHFATQEERVAWGNKWITRGLEALERLLERTAGRYCYGDAVTLADVCLAPQVVGAMRFNVDMSKFPTINRVYAAAGELEAFQKARWDVQPDCPEELRKA